MQSRVIPSGIKVTPRARTLNTHDLISATYRPLWLFNYINRLLANNHLPYTTCKYSKKFFPRDALTGSLVYPLYPEHLIPWLQDAANFELQKGFIRLSDNRHARSRVSHGYVSQSGCIIVRGRTNGGINLLSQCVMELSYFVASRVVGSFFSTAVAAGR